MSLLSPRRILTLTVLAFAAIAVPAAAHGPRPETLPLPDGFQPEGIAALDHDEVLVGSIPTGALYRLNVKTGEGSLLAAGAEGRAAIGLKVADGKVFVSGGPTGKSASRAPRTAASCARSRPARSGRRSSTTSRSAGRPPTSRTPARRRSTSCPTTAARCGRSRSPATSR
jgi:hypothetical protein